MLSQAGDASHKNFVMGLALYRSKGPIYIYNPGATKNRRKKSDLNLNGLKEIFPRCMINSNTTAVKILTVQQVYIAVKFLLS